MSPNGLEFTSTKSPVTAPNQAGTPVRKKSQEFDGKASWEAYRSQFELLAARNGWDDQECVVQLATILKGAALEVLCLVRQCSER